MRRVKLHWHRGSSRFDKVWLAIARRLPQRLKYWVLVAEGARHIANDEVVPDVHFMDILKRSGDAAAR